jgi:ABC-type multidrug transport system ATPase subunit
VIHVQNLVKTFGDVRTVDGVSFEVRAGEIFAFLGPNGAGKTTTATMGSYLGLANGFWSSYTSIDPSPVPMY